MQKEILNMILNNRWIKRIGIAVLAYFSVFSFTYLMQYKGINTYSFLYFIAFGVECYAINRLFAPVDFMTRKERLSAYFFSYLFVMLFLIGIILDCQQYLGGMDIVKTMIASIGIAAIFALLVPKINKGIAYIFSHSQPVFEKKDRKIFVVYAGIFFAMWIPVFLAYYPGVFAYDVHMQVSQKIGTYNTHHPLASTILLQFFYRLGENIGSYNLGIACYTIFQMLIMAMVFAYLILFLYRIRCKRIIRIIVLLFLGGMPFSSVLIISTIKDIVFSACFLSVCICLGYWGIDEDLIKKKKFCILCIVSSIGMCLFRNNGIYISAVLTIVGTFYFKGFTLKKRFIKIMLTGIIVYLLISNSLVYLCQAGKGSANEMLSVPYQQIANVYSYHKDDLKSEIAEEIENILPQVGSYNPYISDPVKGSANAPDHMQEFVKLYFKLLTKYPTHYLSAFLLNTQGYWYIDDISNSQIYGSGLEMRQGYLLTDTKAEKGVEHISYFSQLEQSYELLISANLYQKIPVMASLFNFAIYLWMILYAMFYSFAKGIKHSFLPLVLVSGLIITLFMGPCALIRYAFPYIICIPVIYAGLGNKNAYSDEQTVLRGDIDEE